MSETLTRPSIRAEQRALLDELYGVKGIRGSWEKAGKLLCQKISKTLVPKKGRGGAPFAYLNNLWDFLHIEVYGERVGSSNGFTDRKKESNKATLNFAAKLKLVLLLDSSVDVFMEEVNAEMSKALNQPFDILAFTTSQADNLRRTHLKASKKSSKNDAFDEEHFALLRDLAARFSKEHSVKRWKHFTGGYFLFAGVSKDVTTVVLDYFQEQKSIRASRKRLYVLIMQSRKRLVAQHKLYLEGKTSGQKIWVRAPEHWRPDTSPSSLREEVGTKSTPTTENGVIHEPTGRPFPFFSMNNIADLKRFIVNLKKEEDTARTHYERAVAEVDRTKANLDEISKNLKIVQYALEQFEGED